jgi:hypothetical protein
VLQGELASETTHLWVADKVTRIAWYQKLIEDLDSYLADPELDLRLRHRYTNDVASMLKAVAEEKGELPTRVQLDSGSGALRTEVVGWNPDRWAQQLLDRAGETSAEPYTPAAAAEPDGRGTTPEPPPSSGYRPPASTDPQYEPPKPERSSPTFRTLG